MRILISVLALHLLGVPAAAQVDVDYAELPAPTESEIFSRAVVVIASVDVNDEVVLFLERGRNGWYWPLNGPDGAFRLNADGRTFAYGRIGVVSKRHAGRPAGTACPERKGPTLSHRPPSCFIRFSFFVLRFPFFVFRSALSLSASPRLCGEIWKCPCPFGLYAQPEVLPQFAHL